MKMQAMGLSDSELGSTSKPWMVACPRTGLLLVLSWSPYLTDTVSGMKGLAHGFRGYSHCCREDVVRKFQFTAVRVNDPDVYMVGVGGPASKENLLEARMESNFQSPAPCFLFFSARPYPLPPTVL